MINLKKIYFYILLFILFYCKTTANQTTENNSVKCKKEIIEIIKNKDRQKILKYLDKTFFADFYFNGIVLQRSSKDLIRDILFTDNTMKDKFKYIKGPSFHTLLNSIESSILLTDDLVIILSKTSEYSNLNYSLKISSNSRCILEGVNFENSTY